MDKASSDYDQLFDEAVDLIVRLQNDPDNSVAIETIRRWRQRGPEYERAWSEASEIAGMAGKFVNGRTQSMSRRKLLVGVPILVGSVAMGSYLAGNALLSPRADFASRTAEVRQVALSDGSQATLGPDSAIALDITEVRRNVSLLQGMAYFEVTEDENRPFSIQAGPITATSFGATIDVSNDAGFVTVTVNRGVASAGGPWLSAGGDLRRLEAGDWMSFGDGQPTNFGRREAGQVAAWRDGQIVAEKEPVSAVVARIARWRRGRVVMMSPWLGTQKISGVFDLRDPVLALEAVVHPYGGKVREVSSLLAVVSLI